MTIINKGAMPVLMTHRFAGNNVNPSPTDIKECFRELNFIKSDFGEVTDVTDIDGDDWLKNIPKGTLVALQGRHGTLVEFDKKYPLRKTYFLDEVELEDPETEYERFMKISVK